MTPLALLLTLLGVGYVTRLLMRFFVWLDGADAPEETAAETEAREAACPEDEAPGRAA